LLGDIEAGGHDFGDFLLLSLLVDEVGWCWL